MEESLHTGMTESHDPAEKNFLEGSALSGVGENAELTATPAAQLPATTDHIKIEKNLASLGFFTPSSKRIRDAKAKTVTVMREVEGKRIEAKATIAPAALYGLPITADQDKWLALHSIINDLQQRDGEVKNPIAFTSADLLRILHRHRDSGKNYREIDEWLNVMSSTTIVSEGMVYHAGKRTFAKDRYHVFERAVSLGKEIEPGKFADKNYIWLSEWQLENIRNNYLLPIDLETYRRLKNHIAKALVPLIQVWLYATREKGSFEKRYDELCQNLNIRQYQYLSKIKEKLAPSLDELKEYGYLADWKIETTSDEKSYKVIFWHGEKFRQDRQKRLSQKQRATGVGENESKISDTAPAESLAGSARPQRAVQRRFNLRPAAAAPATSTPPIKKQAPTTKDPDQIEAEGLVRHFHKVFHNVETHEPQFKETVQALNLISQHGPAKARYIVDFSHREAAQTKFAIQTFGGILQYASRAAVDYARAEQEAEAARQRESERQAHQAQELARIEREQEQKRAAEGKLEALPEAERQALYEKHKAALIERLPWMAGHQGQPAFEATVRGSMLTEIMSLPVSAEPAAVPPAATFEPAAATSHPLPDPPLGSENQPLSGNSSEPEDSTPAELEPPDPSGQQSSIRPNLI